MGVAFPLPDNKTNQKKLPLHRPQPSSHSSPICRTRHNRWQVKGVCWLCVRYKPANILGCSFNRLYYPISGIMFCHRGFFFSISFRNRMCFISYTVCTLHQIYYDKCSLLIKRKRFRVLCFSVLLLRSSCVIWGISHVVAKSVCNGMMHVPKSYVILQMGISLTWPALKKVHLTIWPAQLRTEYRIYAQSSDKFYTSSPKHHHHHTMWGRTYPISWTSAFIGKRIGTHCICLSEAQLLGGL